MRAFIKFFFFFLLAASFSCQKNNFVADSNETMTIDRKAAQIIEADNAFGLELFKKIREAREEENVMLSPLSVSVALAMAYNGANAETRTEMEKTMNLNGLTKEQIQEAYQTLLSELQSLDKKVTFEIANALYYSHEFTIKPEFLNITRNVYDAEITSLDFSSSSSVKKINSWVNEKTHGKISDIINQLNPLDRMVLLNAIYFYGTWTKLFDEDGTHKLTFTKSDGTQMQVPMMTKLEQLPYSSTTEFKAVKMPYGEGGYNMVIILPEDGYSSGEIIGNLTPGKWKTWMSDFKPTERVKITMPRFKFAFEVSLIEFLSAMGMQKAFIAEEADFSGITDEDLYISAIKHKTFIDVNETGTEAAAVTAAVFSTTSFMNEPPIVPFFVNKPFIFAITEENSGAVLFIGEVKHPEYNE